MRLDRHVEIGAIALARGFVDARVLSMIMLEIGLAGGEEGDDAWLAPDRLTREQLDVVLAQLGQRPVTATGLGGRATQPSPFPGPAPASVPAGGVVGNVTVPAPPGIAAELAVTRVSSSKPPRTTGASGPSSAGPRSLADGRARYVKRRVLGSGGMGDVDECDDVLLGRRVAVKSVRGEVADQRLARALLEHEAKVAGMLEHPNIIPVYDMGDEAGRGLYYVMRVAEQASLADVLERLAARDPDAMEGHSLGRLLRYFIQVCNAVEYAHSRGYAHRDIKPANILLGQFGEVLLVDWGVAHKLNELPGVFGGTPGYIAPEQLDEKNPIDARSDVFALGAVLYEILCQTPALAHDSAQDLSQAAANPAVGFAVVPPRDRGGAFPIPEDMEDICLRALAVDAAARFPTAKELGAAIEQFLEGTKEKERKHQRASELCENGDALYTSYEELIRERPARVAEFLELRNTIPPWETEDKKQALWDAEDGFAVMEGLAARTMQAVIAAYEQALDEVPNYPAARKGLASLYAAELRRAHDRRDTHDRVHYEERLRQFSDAEELPARLTVDTGTLEAEVHLGKFEDQRRRLVVHEERELGWTPLRGLYVPPGSYQLRLKRVGQPTVSYPVLLRAEAEVDVTVDLSLAAELAEGEVLVPGGPVLLGGEEDGRDLREVVVPSFIIMSEPVSFAQYLDFLGEVYKAHPGLAESYLPLADDGLPYWSWTGTRFKAAKVQPWGSDPATLMRLPVVGVDAWCAEAYAAWRSRRTNRVYRLPTEDEWEKAARGVDGRRYPWGDSFDPSFCKMRDSRPGVPLPEPSGAFAMDVSVYGVRDMAGGVADWVITAADDARDESKARRLVSRGGAFCDPRLDCQLVSRRHHTAEDRSPRLGFRLARTATSRPSGSRISTARSASDPAGSPETRREPSFKGTRPPRVPVADPRREPDEPPPPTPRRPRKPST